MDLESNLGPQMGPGSGPKSGQKLDPKLDRAKIGQGAEKEQFTLCGPPGLGARGGGRRRGRTLLGGLLGRKNL